MDTGTISEAQFLLTELQYTLGQLHVQLGDLDAETRRTALCGDRSIEQVVSDLVESEKRYQGQYARLLGLPPAGESEADHIALPVDDAVQQPGAQASFEHMRTRTIEMLSRAEDKWSPEVLELVKRQVAEDRHETTQIAECRKQVFVEDTRPDLLEPITTAPAPHEMTEGPESEAAGLEESAAQRGE